YGLARLGVVPLVRVGAFNEAHRVLSYTVSRSAIALWPTGPGRAVFLFGVEWTLVYEVFLSVAVAGLSLAGGRRGVPVLAGAWLAVIAGKMALWPGYAFAPFPHWSTLAL